MTSCSWSTPVEDSPLTRSFNILGSSSTAKRPGLRTLNVDEHDEEKSSGNEWDWRHYAVVQVGKTSALLRCGETAQQLKFFPPVYSIEKPPSITTSLSPAASRHLQQNHS